MLRKRFVFFVLFVFALLLVHGFIAAHESRTAGDYQLIVGWRVEPALVGYPNGAEVTIQLAEGVAGEIESILESEGVALQVEVTFGPAAKVLNLQQDGLQINHLSADLIPTRPGDYTFRIFGTIGEVAIDETFSSTEGQFSSVEPASDVTFPDELSSLLELSERIAELEARLAALEGND